MTNENLNLDDHFTRYEFLVSKKIENIYSISWDGHPDSLSVAWLEYDRSSKVLKYYTYDYVWLGNRNNPKNRPPFLGDSFYSKVTYVRDLVNFLKNPKFAEISLFSENPSMEFCSYYNSYQICEDLIYNVFEDVSDIGIQFKLRIKTVYDVKNFYYENIIDRSSYFFQD